MAVWCGINAGVVDAGYEGAMGALMEVKNPNGIVLVENAKLAQIVFEEMSETVEAYNGVYQSSVSGVGRDGTHKGERPEDTRSSIQAISKG